MSEDDSSALGTVLLVAGAAAVGFGVYQHVKRKQRLSMPTTLQVQTLPPMAPPPQAQVASMVTKGLNYATTGATIGAASGVVAGVVPAVLPILGFIC